MRIHKNIFRLFFRQDSGATALEFGFVLPVLLLFIFGIFEFGLIMHVSSLVENASHEGSRYAITGSSYEDLNPEGLSREEFIEQYIRKRVGLWVRESEQITVETTVVGNIVDLGHGGPDAGSVIPNGGLGSGGQAVIYQVTYFWHIMTPMMGQIIGDENDAFPISATVVVKNEDFCGQRHCPGAP